MTQQKGAKHNNIYETNDIIPLIYSILSNIYIHFNPKPMSSGSNPIGWACNLSKRKNDNQTNKQQLNAHKKFKCTLKNGGLCNILK